MLKKFLAKIGRKRAPAAHGAGVGFHQPYVEPHVNFLYNLLFCDDLTLFKNSPAEAKGIWATLLADRPDLEALRSLAEGEGEEGRVRALACQRLRAEGQVVPKGKLFGVIVEVPLEQGLDALAAFSDGGVRYLNQSGKVTIFEAGGPPEVGELVKEVVAVAQPVVARIEPSNRKRPAPPRGNNVRLTILAPDGPHLCEDPFEALERDTTSGPVLAKATQLLRVVVDTGMR